MIAGFQRWFSLNARPTKMTLEILRLLQNVFGRTDFVWGYLLALGASCVRFVGFTARRESSSRHGTCAIEFAGVFHLVFFVCRRAL